MDDLLIRIKKILDKFQPDQWRRQIRELEAAAEKPEFWRDHETAGRKMQELARFQEQVGKLERLEEWVTVADVTDETKERENGDAKMENLVGELEAELYLSGPYDHLPAVVAIHSGQGGVEAMDWANMLYRMYSRYVQSEGWKLAEIDWQPGDEAGIKEVVFEVTGQSAYGKLKHEAGVHRLVRNSPFNANNLRQTSFALVEVMPLVEETREEELREEDLEWQFYRSGGHGGQNVNKVSSAVRLRHRLTGLVVTCQKERDQARNRQVALQILRGKLLARQIAEQEAEKIRLKGKHVTPGWGNQIRSYVLSPYHLVKDLRTDYEETDSAAVLDGKLAGFIDSELHYFSGV